MNRIISRRILQFVGALILAWSMTSGLFSSLAWLQPAGLAPSLTQAQVISPTHLSLTGPLTGTINQTYDFTATVSPLSATTPLTYLWQVTDLTSSISQTAELTHTQAFSWPTSGLKQLSVTASNGAGVVTAQQIISVSQPPPITPPITLSLSGPLTGQMFATYHLTAQVNSTATLPLTYLWSATDYMPLTTTAGVSDSQTFSWTTTGTKTISLQVSNSAGQVTGHYTLPIAFVPVSPLTLMLSGPSTGQLNQTTTLTASVNPLTTTTPLTYVWQVSQQPTITQAGSLSQSQAFSWPMTGSQWLTVTAFNAWGAVSQSHAINLQEVIIPPSNLSVSGPTSGTVNISYPFAASIDPLSVTTPLTYIWQATDFSQPLTLTGQLSSSQRFAWNVSGPKTITVTAFNAAGRVTNTYRVTVETMPLISPTGVTISGPQIGAAGLRYDFIASIDPLTTTSPLTYVWQVSQQPTITQTGGLTQHQSFLWPVTGTQWLTVTAFNEVGLVSQSHLISLTNIVIPPSRLNLSGPLSGTVNQSYTFLISAEPLSTTTPLTYIWQATDFSQPLTLTGQLSDSRHLAWSLAGTKRITVTGFNEAGRVTATYTVTIHPPPTVPPSQLAISGPQTGTVGATYDFLASVDPLTTTRPLTYLWQVSQQPTITQTGGLSQSQHFTWPVSGTHWLTVTAMNQAGAVSQTHSLTLVEPTTIVSLTGVIINGPFRVILGGEDFFRAVIMPPEATQPITYTWLTQPYQGQDSPLVSYVWTMTGSQVITVVADNGFSEVTGSYQVIITQPSTILIPPTSTVTSTVTPMPSPTTTVTGTPTPPLTTTTTPTATATLTPTVTPSPTTLPTAAPTNSPTPTSTPTATPSHPAAKVYLPMLLSSGPLPSVTATPTASPTPTATATFTPTPTASPTNTPSPTATVSPRPTNTPTRVVTPIPISDRYEQQVIELTNQERAKHGCGPLTQNELLMQAAERHSRDMALNDFFDHTGSDGSDAGDRIADTGYLFSTWAENIAAGYTSPQAVVDGWMNSEGHRKNILNCGLQEIGVAHYYLVNDEGSENWHHYWTQVFGIPR